MIVEHYFFGENSFVFGVFGSRRGLQANHGTVRKSAKLKLKHHMKIPHFHAHELEEFYLLSLCLASPRALRLSRTCVFGALYYPSAEENEGLHVL